jgi:predicted ATPase
MATTDSERAMIESIEFTNFKALRKTTLPLAPFTLLLGPNGSGKTTVLQGLQGIAVVAARFVGIRPRAPQIELVWSELLSVTAPDRSAPVEIKLRLRLKKQPVVATFQWHPTEQVQAQFNYVDGSTVQEAEAMHLKQWLARMASYVLDFSAIAQPVPVTSESLGQNGGGLAAVLDDLKDNHPERWQSLLAEMCEWLPEYDHILFDKPKQGQKGIVLRTKKGGHRIPAKQLSQGTLVALALLALAYSPDPPSLVGLEEIDRGLHPRLLRHLQDALYRLSYPESCGETRPPIQVIATTHSPYLLDLYRDHPDEVVLAQKEGLEVTMKRLTDIEHYEEILGESPLSEVWYSGVLGGVSVKP